MSATTFITDEGKTIRNKAEANSRINRLINQANGSYQQALAYEEIIEALRDLAAKPAPSSTYQSTLIAEIARNKEHAKEMWDDQEWRLAQADSIARHFNIKR